MVARDFLSSVSLDDLKMMRRVFNQLRQEFGYEPHSSKAEGLTLDIVAEFKAGNVQEHQLRAKLVTKHGQ
ncbi:MAG: hypothetical protein AB1440_26475 [Pseudomonadota bacterium]|jgi:hypothetical protein